MNKVVPFEGVRQLTIDHLIRAVQSVEGFEDFPPARPSACLITVHPDFAAGLPETYKGVRIVPDSCSMSDKVAAFRITFPTRDRQIEI